MQRRPLIQSRIETSNRGVGTRIQHQRNSSVQYSGRSSSLFKCLILTPLISLVCLELYATIYIMNSTDAGASFSLRGIRNRPKHPNRLIDVILDRNQNNTSKVHQINQPIKQKPILLSRNANVTVTSSARGNLGPPTVLNQIKPGKDWLKDRWQAASDMHGSAIPGSHWVMLDFSAMFHNSEGAIHITKVILDWETAYSSDYRIESRMDAPTTTGGENDDWCLLFDAGDEPFGQRNAYPHASVEQHGQSPGVKERLPLHVIHKIYWMEGVRSDIYDEKCLSMRYLRIFIRKSARGWGVSLWQVDVYGYTTLLSDAIEEQ